VVEDEFLIALELVDVNLAGEWVTPVAEALRVMVVPFILATGYVAPDLQASRFSGVPST